MIGFVFFWFSIMFAFTILTCTCIENMPTHRNLAPFALIGAMLSTAIFVITLSIYLYDLGMFKGLI